MMLKYIKTDICIYKDVICFKRLLTKKKDTKILDIGY